MPQIHGSVRPHHHQWPEAQRDGEIFLWSECKCSQCADNAHHSSFPRCLWPEDYSLTETAPMTLSKPASSYTKAACSNEPAAEALGLRSSCSSYPPQRPYLVEQAHQRRLSSWSQNVSSSQPDSAGPLLQGSQLKHKSESSSFESVETRDKASGVDSAYSAPQLQRSHLQV